MLSKNELKYYSSLLIKKFRLEENKFIVEGKKIVEEALRSDYECEIIIASNEFAEKEKSFLDSTNKKIRLEKVSNLEFYKLKDTAAPQGIAAVFAKKRVNRKETEKIKDNLICCLDNISDPGNVGTILRNCDWFGVKNVLLTENCAEIFNPKTIRASMGSVFHLNIFEDSRNEDMKKLKKKGYNILCSDLEGENVFSFRFRKRSLLVFSNEANGPSKEIIKIADTKLTIPSYGKAESLNVASASAIILSEARKKII